jgi:Arc/MetJ-type ribon-helix-helix transcriptional regulator
MTTVTISLPDQVARRVDDAVDSQGFATRSEFIRNLIRGYFFKEVSLEEYKAKPLTQVKKDLMATGKYKTEFVNSIMKGLKKSSAYGSKAVKT